MTTIQKETLTIPELIKVISDIQTLIANNVESPFCPMMTNEALGKAYKSAVDALALSMCGVKHGW